MKADHKWMLKMLRRINAMQKRLDALDELHENAECMNGACEQMREHMYYKHGGSERDY